MTRLRIAVVFGLLVAACSPNSDPAAESTAGGSAPSTTIGPTPEAAPAASQAPAPVPQVSFPAIAAEASVPGWTAIELPEGVGVANGAMAWTGDELVLWGGQDGSSDDAPVGEPGMALHLGTLTWRSLPPSPKQAAFGAAAVWTGEQLIVCCGASGSNEGAAYDPGTDSWEELWESPPLGPFAEAVWTGDQVLVTTRSGVAAYAPASSQWRLYKNPPLPLERFNRVAWTGDELVVWPAALQRRVYKGMALEPIEGTWRLLPEPPAWPAAPDVVWVGDQLIVWGGLPAAFEESQRAVGSSYDPITHSWSELTEPLPEPEACECNLGGQTLVWTGDELLVSTGHFGSGVDRSAPLLLAYDPASASWSLVGPSPFAGRASGIMADDRIVVRSDRLYVSEPGWADHASPVPPEGLAPSNRPGLPTGGPELSAAPAAVTDRVPLPYCGAFITSLADIRVFEGLVHDPTAADCFADRVERGLGAELITVSFTIEGDAILTVLRSQRPGPIEAFVDTTRDNNGARRWTAGTCKGFDGTVGEARTCADPVELRD